MSSNQTLKEAIFAIDSAATFEKVTLDVFRYQAQHTPTYRTFLQHLHLDPSAVTSSVDIPFLPIEFFKTQRILAEGMSPETTFTSSGTTGMATSQHHVADLSMYEKSYRLAFSSFYGSIDEYVVLALLPSYLEREGSSLIYMVDDLIRSSTDTRSGYFLYDHHQLYQRLLSLREQKKKSILFGVTYALLDFVETYRLDFPDLIIMETGGMKGKRREMVREELHNVLNNGFGTYAIHSEYGMTELLSQAYSKGRGLFETPPWMKVTLRDLNDPLSSITQLHKTGAVNVMDLANLYSCAFVATQDLGKLHSTSTFEILGRFDNSDIRGCNLLVQ